MTRTLPTTISNTFAITTINIIIINATFMVHALQKNKQFKCNDKINLISPSKMVIKTGNLTICTALVKQQSPNACNKSWNLPVEIVYWSRDLHMGSVIRYSNQIQMYHHICHRRHASSFIHNNLHSVSNGQTKYS